MLEAWCPGTSGGEAIARVLFGEVNPSGHLPASFPVSVADLSRPVLDGDPTKPDQRFAVDYHEGAAIGYKWYDLKKIKPLFPFGYGLSYTQFAYSNLLAEEKNGQLHVRFRVTNTGNVAGKDVPQLYVAASNSKWEAPKRLAGWDKLTLKPDQSSEVALVVEPRLLGVFDGASKTWHISAGKYQLSVAHHAADTSNTKDTSVTVQLSPRTLDIAGKSLK